MVPCIVTLY